MIAGHNNVRFMHDSSRPGGPNVKLMDTTKMKEKPKIHSSTISGNGIRESVIWFLNNIYSKEIARH